MMTSEEERGSVSRSECEGESEGGEGTAQEPNATPPNTLTDQRTLINRRGKIVNGFVDGNKNVKVARENKRTRSKKPAWKGRGSQGSDSGVGEGSESEPTKSGVEKRSGEAGGEKGNRNGRTSGGSNASKKEEMTQLEQELEQEMRYRATLEQLLEVKRYLSSKDPDTIQWSVAVLQQSVDELKKQLDAVKEGGQEEGSEFKLRFEAQKRLNAKLEEQTEWYQSEVNKTREKIKRGQEYTFDQDLDQYTEFELLRMVKSLERERNNLYSDLRGKSWLLDNQSKEYYHLKELIRAYTGDLTMVNRSLEQLWKQRSLSHDSAFTGGATPVTSPGGVKWSGQSGIRPSQRILDPRKGPIRKTAGVRSLPRLDQEALDHYTSSNLFRKARSRSRGHPSVRAKSLDTRKEDMEAPEVVTALSPVHRAKSEEGQSQRSSSGVFDESYEASNEASTTASVELGSDKL